MLKTEAKEERLYNLSTSDTAQEDKILTKLQLYPTHSFKMMLKQNMTYDLLNCKKHKHSHWAEEVA